MSSAEPARSDYDLVADILATNNNYSIIAVSGTILFGCIATYGIVLTWRHQRWEVLEQYRQGPGLRRFGASA